MSSRTERSLAGLSCASIVDAMGRLYPHRADLSGFVSPTPERVLFGPAATIAFLPFRSDLRDEGPSFASLFYEAIGDTPAGQVLVLSSGGYPDVSHGGGTKLTRAEHHNLAGVLADGRLRDFAELRRCRFVAYCRGEATRAGGDVVMPFAAGAAVEIDGVTVQPGDYIYADASGGVVIPAAALEDVLAAARAVAAEDERARVDIRAETPQGARQHRSSER